MMRLTRRYGFSAAHVLARPDWDEARNRSTYGKCANPAGHGHNYVLEVSVRGEPDRHSGRIVLPEVLDRSVHERVLRHLDGRFLNREIGAFRERVPTAENIAAFAWEALHDHVGPALLDAVRLEETSKNAVELEADGPAAGPAAEEVEAWVASKG
jgi:6-pyruvoyltetrahydropterin/6-carboxytetrahydropterin synthase